MDNNYVEVDLNNIAFNTKSVLHKFNNYKYYIGVVKGNAYGHGYEVANTMIENGINYLAVSDITEARKLKKVLKRDIPILIMTPTDLNCIDECIENNFTIVISNYNYYQDLKKLNKKIKVHLIINSGMNRLGLNKIDEIETIYHECFNTQNNIILEGIFTHMATLGIIDTNWDNQLKTFKILTKNIDLKRIDIVHISCSSSLIIHPKIEFCNGIRIGSLLYGVSIIPINEDGFINKLKKIKRNAIRKQKNISLINPDFNIELKQALTLYSKVLDIKDVSSNSYVGYNASYKTENDIKVAVVGMGYANGLPFNNYNRKVKINDTYYSIIGSTNMNMLTVMVDSKVKINDKVILLDNMKDTRIVANIMGVSPVYLFTSINEGIKRNYIINNKKID